MLTIPHTKRVSIPNLKKPYIEGSRFESRQSLCHRVTLICKNTKLIYLTWNTMKNKINGKLIIK